MHTTTNFYDDVIRKFFNTMFTREQIVTDSTY